MECQTQAVDYSARVTVEITTPAVGRSVLGSRLAAFRRTAGLTQTALSAALGLSEAQIGRVERGKRLTDGALLWRWLLLCDAISRWDELTPLLPTVMVLDGSESAADSR